MKLPWRQPEPEPEPDEVEIDVQGLLRRLVDGPWMNLGPVTQVTVPADYPVATWTVAFNAMVAAQVGYGRLLLHTEGRN